MKYLIVILLLISCTNDTTTPAKPSTPGQVVVKGDPGASAYDIWLRNGNTGTEADFLNWIKGSIGPKGDKGEPGNDVPLGWTSIESLGCKADDPNIDNAAIINNKLADKYGHFYLFVPQDKIWYAHSTINSTNKTINLMGLGSERTIWKRYGGGSAYYISRTKYYDDAGKFLVMDPVTIKGITFTSETVPPTASLDSAGLKIYHIANIDDVAIVGFTGGGLQMYGQLSSFLNCSFSVIQNCKIANIKGDAVMIVGPDANMCTFRNLDIRDCTGIGFNDRSFLGNTVQGVMVHACERSFYVEYGYTAHTSFIGCYHETGQKLPAVNYGGAVKELPYFEGMFSWDLSSTKLN